MQIQWYMMPLLLFFRAVQVLAERWRGWGHQDLVAERGHTDVSGPCCRNDGRRAKGHRLKWLDSFQPPGRNISVLFGANSHGTQIGSCSRCLFEGNVDPGGINPSHYWGGVPSKSDESLLKGYTPLLMNQGFINPGLTLRGDTPVLI